MDELDSAEGDMEGMLRGGAADRGRDGCEDVVGRGAGEALTDGGWGDFCGAGLNRSTSGSGTGTGTGCGSTAVGRFRLAGLI